MTSNFPGPYELRVFYTTGSATLPPFQHVLKINFACSTPPDVGELYSNIMVERENAVPIQLASVVNDLVADLTEFFNDTYSTIDYTEVWKYTPGTFDATWVATRTEEEAGTSITDTVPAGQFIMTFRTAEGGILKCTLMETIVPPQTTIRVADFIALLVNLRDNYLMGDDNWMLGRDTSYGRATIGAYPGVNERLFKARYRP